jgi:ribosomal protein L37AE/L43A
MPRPDFPRSVREFQRRFADEEACRLYLAASRWPDGYRCPRCGFGEALELPTRRLWRCKKCGRDTSVSGVAAVPKPRPTFGRALTPCSESKPQRSAIRLRAPRSCGSLGVPACGARGGWRYQRHAYPNRGQRFRNSGRATLRALPIGVFGIIRISKARPMMALRVDRVASRAN